MLISVLIALSLCADCFAVSLCSGVRASGAGQVRIALAALGFAVIQSLFLLLGWAFGVVLSRFVVRVSEWIAMALLLYVGINMLLDGVRALRGGRVAEGFAIDGLWSVIMGGVATSLDALSVGASRAMEGEVWADFLPLAVAVFVVTLLSVEAGLNGGRFAGRRFGHWAEVAGGVVLICIGVHIVL